MSAGQEAARAAESYAGERYKYGFVTDVEADSAPLGLDHGTIRFISAKKGEPEWLFDWRIKAFERWLKMEDEEPTWAKVHYPPIDYQAACYYSAPKSDSDRPKSLDEIDPELLKTYEKLGIPLREQEMLAGVAVDAVFDSVSVATTFKGKLAEMGIIFCPISEAVKEHPELVRRYLGSVVPYSDNFFATLNSAVFTDGSFVYVPKGVRCPMELSTYFRINAANTGQFERTLIIADEGSYVSYLEGCTAPMRDENQLHAAVVELVALDDAEIKYSTVQNWYPGDAEGRGGIYNFVTKRGACRGANAKISWTQVETGSAITWKYPSCILQGDNSVGEFYSIAITNNCQQADTGTKMIHIGRNTKSRIVAKGIAAGRSDSTYRGLVRIQPKAEGARKPHPVRFAADRRRVRRPHRPLYRIAQPHGTDRARGHDLEDQRGPALLLPAARHRRGGCRGAHRERLLPRGAAGAADGVRGRGAEAGGHQPRRQRRLERYGRFMSKPMLLIENLHVTVDGKTILNGLDLAVNTGEVHAVMGPNGSGKSTLAYVIAGREGYAVSGGSITFRGDDVLAMSVEERALNGVFLAFQYPVEIPGVGSATFLKTAVNAGRKHRGEKEYDAMEFLKLVKAKHTALGIDDGMMRRALNVGFSGGEKKRNEMLQMALLEPALAVLDETDSGLDIDALKVVANGINALRGPERAMVVITHYQRLLDHVVPDRVHVLAGGRIVRSGGRELALELERNGYAGFGLEPSAAA